MKSINYEIFSLFSRQQECLDDLIITYIDINDWKIFPRYITSPTHLRMNGIVGFRNTNNIVFGIHYAKITQLDNSLRQIDFIHNDYNLWEKHE